MNCWRRTCACTACFTATAAGARGDAFTAIDCDFLRTCYLKIVTYSYQPNVAAARGWESHLTEHRLILDALRRRDYEALRFTVQQHILQVEQEGDPSAPHLPAVFLRVNPFLLLNGVGPASVCRRGENGPAGPVFPLIGPSSYERK